ncbi:MAG: glycoside hydrolase family 6 protein [Myxococcota bacterium]
MRGDMSPYCFAAIVVLALTSACRKSVPPVPVVEAPIEEEVPVVEPELPEPPPEHARVDNPFEGARFFVNPHYRAAALETKAYAPPELHGAIDRVSETSTAVWLPRITAITGDEGRPSLRDQLDEALRQEESSQQPLTMVLVVYNLPDRDCAAGASAGELRLEEDGLRRYREEFIDPIVATLAEPAYRPLRLAVVIEPDSLPNLVTNLESHEACRVAAPAYREGVAYAIAQLATVSNAYLYLDVAHSGWLGWDRPPEVAALYREVMAEAGGEELVTGFATNVSNYTPIEENLDPFGAVEVHKKLIEGFYSWNPIIDEHRYVDALREHFPDHGFLIDTSRNGWGGRLLDAPLDGRSHRGNWCNIRDAGLGASPRANPREGIHAYFWIKPPGESDGAADPSLAREGKPYDEMCGARPGTDARPGAPVAGEWFAEAFLGLLKNANPPF